jgi:hypothetical protein
MVSMMWRDGPSLGDPSREIAGAVMASGGRVDACRIGPHAEVAYMENPVELHAEARRMGVVR